MQLFLFVCLLLLLPVYPFKTQHLKAQKGKFFVHTLHSAYFFPKSAKVKWEATLQNKPAMPAWLRLLPSRYPEIAYLVGTPVTNANQVTIHIIAKRLDNFEIQQQHLVISLTDDSKYTGTTKQVFEIHIKNVDTEEFVANRNRQIEDIENAARQTFRGKGVNPYIADVRPEFVMPNGQEHLFRNKIGTIVSIGTQRGFYPATYAVVHNLQSNPVFCRRTSQVAMNKFFAPKFTVDWCQTQIKNVTDMDESMEIPQKTVIQPMKTGKGKAVEAISEEEKPESPPREIYGFSGYNFWNSVILFPAIGIIFVILLLVLSMIFFGSREGQKWRDYKTPKGKLEEYMSVRESQKHLRELSVQRQLLSMSQDRASAAPTGIHSFLQPRSRAASASIARFSKSASRLNDREDTVELLPTAEMIPVGKQTVAEAAKQCGSSLHLYRNPLDSESDDNDSDSLEEKPII